MMRNGILLFMLMAIASLSAKNLELLKTIEPFNFEQIDVEIDGNRMLIPAGLGGAELYDISNPRNPLSIGNIELFQCDWGRTYNWELVGDHAIGTSRDCGFAIVDISNPARPDVVAYRNANNDFDPSPGQIGGASIEDVEVHKDIAIFAAHSAGLAFYDINFKSSPRFIRTLGTHNAWSLALDRPNNLAYIADGDAGIRVARIDNPENAAVIGQAETSGTARDIRLQGNHLFVAVGTAGVDVFDVTDPSAPRLLDNFPTLGFTFKVAVHGNLVSLASWDFLHVLRFHNNKLEHVGYKNTGGRVMAVGAVDNIIYSAEWENLLIYEFGEITEPDIDFQTRLLNFGQVDIGQSKTLPLNIENNGQSTLDITGIAFSYDDYTTPETSFSVAPGTSTVIDITYRPTRTFAGGNVIIFSNDPDENESFVQLQGNNTREVQEGDVAPNFSLPIVANGSGTLTLEELRGRVVVLALFASW